MASYARHTGSWAGILRKRGVPETPDALHRFCTITAAMEGRAPQWRFVQDNQIQRLNVQSQLTVTSFQAAVMAAREGWGLTQVMSYQVAPHLASGALQVVLRRACSVAHSKSSRLRGWTSKICRVSIPRAASSGA